MHLEASKNFFAHCFTKAFMFGNSENLALNMFKIISKDLKGKLMQPKMSLSRD